MKQISWLVALLFTANLQANTLKKVLVLDFKNILKKQEFNYLEGSITDAVRNSLKEKFVFQEMERVQWLEAAKDIYVVEDDFYTYSAAMNLGLATRHDVVIFGGFLVDTLKGGVQQMRTRVRILDLGKKKQIADFEMQNPIDNTIFNAVDKIAERIVKEAAAVLPSKEDAAAGRFKVEIPSFNQLSLRGQVAPLTINASRVIAPASQHAGSDFKNTLGVVLDFQHFGIFKEQLGVFAAGVVRSANDEFSYKLDSSAVPVSLQSFGGQAGFAWRQKLGNRFYLQPLLGGGAQYDILKFTYKNQTIAVTNSTGQVMNANEYSLLTPFAMAGLRFGYAVNSWLMVETGAQYNFLLYQGTQGHSLFAELGVGFKL